MIDEGLTRDTVATMAAASIRDLRNHGGDVIARVLSGEAVTVTRDGVPVAELRPVPRPRVPKDVLIQRFRGLPSVDAARLRADVDALVDQAL